MSECLCVVYVLCLAVHIAHVQLSEQIVLVDIEEYKKKVRVFSVNERA